MNAEVLFGVKSVRRWAMGLMLATIVSVTGLNARIVEAAEPIVFDMPAMPLARAMSEFSKRTSYLILASDVMLSGRQARRVRE